VRYDGKLCDSEAVAGAAHGVRHAQPLRAEDFSGGDAVAAKLLRGPGFPGHPTLRRTREEAVLARGLVYRNGWRTVAAETADVKELSALLRQSERATAGAAQPPLSQPG
jgi:hypothetical protein